MKGITDKPHHQWRHAALMFATLSLFAGVGLGGCGGSSDSATAPTAINDPGNPPPGGEQTIVALTGNLIGDAAASLTGAPLAGVEPAPGTPSSVPLTEPVSVVLMDETGQVAATKTVTAADGNFTMSVPSGHSYIMLFRIGGPSGQTIAHLLVDRETKRMTFSLPNGAADLNMGNLVLDTDLGEAWYTAPLVLAEAIVPVPLEQIEFMSPTDAPTGGAPSPLFGAEPFTQQMILFEEFGTETMPAGEQAGFTPMPRPVNAQSGPLSADLDAFLAQAGMAPFPDRLADVVAQSPWKLDIETFLGRALAPVADGLAAGPADGRPSGEQWSQQNWTEFYPKQYYKTAQAGARINGGLRNTRQRHGYAKGEFGPQGLYHKVYSASVPGSPVLTGSTAGLPIQIHPKMPVQHQNSVWTFDGTLPPKLLQIRYGVPALMRHYNALPIDVTANNGFGRHTITTHDHNGHNPAESDGFANGFYFPGQYWDYRWPMQLAGFTSINTGASDPRAAIPCEVGETFPVMVNDVLTNKACTDGTITMPGDWRETMSTHWFHDHMLDHTAENVYKGNATMMNYYSALDRGNEGHTDGVNLRLPSGTALNWGNRDYDVNLLVADKAWDADGQLWFNTADHETGFIADVMTANWLYKPYMDVRARSYRFRILNGSVSRMFAIAMVQQVAGDGGELPGPAGSGISYNRVPFHMIGNDGNIMEHAVPFDGNHDHGWGHTKAEWKGQLPTQSIAERYDIVVNFSKHGIKPGDKLYFVNIMEHQDGKGSRSKVALADILSGKYNPIVKDGRWINGDPVVGKFLELRVKAYAGTDLAMNPAAYEPGKLKMIPLTIDRANKTVNGESLLTAKHHTFELVHSGGGTDNLGKPGPWFIKVDGGDRNAANPQRISAIERGALEIWKIKGTGGWTHPMHVHYEEGIILTRGGKKPPPWEYWARKDMYRVGPEDDSTGVVELAYRARDFTGTYVAHCHNTMHEDHAMLSRWDSMQVGNAVLMDTPMPTWDGVRFEPSFKLPFADGIGDGTGAEEGLPE